MPNVTVFNPKERYILLPAFIITADKSRHEFDVLLDTGAPATEFSDQALQLIGLLSETKKDIGLKPGLQTQKYAKITLPMLEICSHRIDDLEVYVSHFEKSWGVDALIGLDFFRRFEVKINYKLGQITTSPL